MNAIVLALALAPAPLAVPTEHQTVFVVMLQRAEDGPQLSDDAQRMLGGLHIQYHQQLQQQGAAVTAGRFADAAPGAPSGMTLLCAGSLADAERLAAADPYVQFGQMTVSVRAWQVPAGTFSCRD